jgi:NAD(P)-dependent dehydrogenase (short-subunit alcohol dehydrogenase family)
LITLYNTGTPDLQQIYRTILMSTTDTSSTPRVVVLTGVLGGIGSAIAELMHDEGYLVVGLDRCPPPDGVIPKSIDSFIQCDISKLVGDTEEAVVLGQSIVDATQKISGSNKLTALINNAAYQVVAPIEDTSMTMWSEVMATNVGAPFALAKLFLPQLTAAKGSIINIASIHANLTKPEFVAYASSKGALVSLTKALAVELGPKNVRVNAVLPAATSTPMLMAGFDGKAEAFKALEGMHPLQRICEPKEIAEFVEFLAGDKCHFITGSCLQIDGGIGSRLHDPV